MAGSEKPDAWCCQAHQYEIAAGDAPCSNGPSVCNTMFGGGYLCAKPEGHEGEHSTYGSGAGALGLYAIRGRRDDVLEEEFTGAWSSKHRRLIDDDVGALLAEVERLREERDLLLDAAREIASPAYRTAAGPYAGGVHLDDAVALTDAVERILARDDQ